MPFPMAFSYKKPNGSFHMALFMVLSKNINKTD